MGTVGVTRDTCPLNLVENSRSESYAGDLGASRSPLMTESFLVTELIPVADNPWLIHLISTWITGILEKLKW